MGWASTAEVARAFKVNPSVLPTAAVPLIEVFANPCGLRPHDVLGCVRILLALAVSRASSSWCSAHSDGAPVALV